MTFERLHGDVLDVVHSFAEELFGSGGDGDVVAFDFDLRDTVHLHGHALARVNFRRLHINGEEFQRKDVHLLNNRINECATALDDAEAAHAIRAVRVGVAMFASGHDEHFVRPDLRVTAQDDGDADEDHQRNDNDGDKNDPAGENIG